MKRFVLLASLTAALAAIALAGTASAHVVLDPGGAAANNSGPASSTSSSDSTSESDETEATGTATASVDGTSVTITGIDGSSVTCAVPVGFDLTPFLTGQVEAECELVNGQLMLSEIVNETSGVEAEVEDDDTVEVGDDDADEDADDDIDDDADDDAEDDIDDAGDDD